MEEPSVAQMRAQLAAMKEQMEENQRALDANAQFLQNASVVALPPRPIMVDDILRGYKASGFFHHRVVRVVDVRAPTRANCTSMQLKVICVEGSDPEVSRWITAKAFCPVESMTMAHHRYRHIVSFANPQTGCFAVVDALHTQPNDAARALLLYDIMIFTETCSTEEFEGVGILAHVVKTSTPWRRLDAALAVCDDALMYDVLEARKRLPKWPKIDGFDFLRRWAQWIDTSDQAILSREHVDALVGFVAMLDRSEQA